MSLDLMLELAWKSGLLAGAALVGASLLRSRPAAERVAVLRLGVVMLLALPLLAVLMPALRVEAPVFAAPAETTGATVAPPHRAPSPAIGVARARSFEPAVAPPLLARTEKRIDPVVIALALWTAGFAFLMLRLLAGVTLLHRWTRRAEPVADARWLAALARIAQGRTPPVLRASPRVGSPLSWGWRPAIILLDPAALDQAERADAVLAHEMGHVRHGDWLFLMAARLLLALFWFNPLVWSLQRELALQSEQAADAWAAGRIGRADYATALVAMAARGRPHAALGMAAPKGELARRVIAIMTASTAGGKPWRTALTITACVGFATPLAAIELRPATATPALPSGLRSTTVGPRAESPTIAAAALAAAMTRTAARPDDASVPPAQLATVLRQRDQGLALMEAGARVMETRAQEMRALAAGLDAADRAALNADADALMGKAAGLRGKARELAARDPATLQPLSPEEERDMLASMEDVLASGGPLDGDRNEGKVGVEAGGPVRTSVDLRIDAGGPVRTDVEVSMAPPPVQMRQGAREMRQGAVEMDAGADDLERSIAADPASPHAREGPAQIVKMRQQADEMRRQADVIDAQADRTEAAG